MISGEIVYYQPEQTSREEKLPVILLEGPNEVGNVIILLPSGKNKIVPFSLIRPCFDRGVYLR